MRPAHLLAVLKKEFDSVHHGHHTPVMMWGPPGVGKSQMVAQVAQHYEVPIIDIRLSLGSNCNISIILSLINGSSKTDLIKQLKSLKLFCYYFY